MKSMGVIRTLCVIHIFWTQTGVLVHYWKSIGQSTARDKVHGVNVLSHVVSEV